MQTIIRYAKQFVQYVRNNRAVSALEYAILIGIIAVAITAALSTLGDDMETAIEAVSGNVKTGGDNVGDIGPSAPSPSPN